MKKGKVIIIGLIVTLVLCGMAEAFLRIMGLGVPAADPYLDISGDLEVYGNTGEWMQTRPDRARLFRGERFEVEKPPGVRRVFCLGGSAVYGFPYEQPLAWPALLEAGLEAGTKEKWQVINSGAVAHASYRVMKIAGEVLRYQPDAIVVMSGHNEFLEKRVYGETLSANPLLKGIRTAMGRLHLFTLVRKAVIRPSSGETPLLGEEISWDYVLRDEKQIKLTEEHYRHSLEMMVTMAKKKGVPIILVTLPSNLKDYPPLGGDGNDEAHKKFASGKKLLEQNNVTEAYNAFRQAADMDIHPVRAFSAYNAVIIEVASEKGAVVADSAKSFIDASGGIPGDDLFLDHVHFRSEGAVIVANDVARTLPGAGLLASGDLASVQSGIEAAGKSLSNQQEAKARYGAAYESWKYMHKPERAERLLNEALELTPRFPDGRQLLMEVKRNPEAFP